MGDGRVARWTRHVCIVYMNNGQFLYLKKSVTINFFFPLLLCRAARHRTNIFAVPLILLYISLVGTPVPWQGRDSAGVVVGEGGDGHLDPPDRVPGPHRHQAVRR